MFSALSNLICGVTIAEEPKKTIGKNAIIYCRVSSKKQSDFIRGNTSLIQQSEACQKYCKDNGIKVKDIFTEIVSARENKQIVLDKLIKKISPGDILIVHNISRFSRNLLLGLTRLSKIVRQSADVYSVSENSLYTRSAADRNMWNISLNSAELESNQISERVRRSVRYRKQHGARFGKPGFGYEAYRDKSGIRKFKINNAETKIVRDVVKMRSRGKSYRDIAEFLNNNGVKYRNGVEWTANRVNRIAKVDLNNLTREIRAVNIETRYPIRRNKF